MKTVLKNSKYVLPDGHACPPWGPLHKCCHLSFNSVEQAGCYEGHGTEHPFPKCSAQLCRFSYSVSRAFYFLVRLSCNSSQIQRNFCVSTYMWVGHHTRTCRTHAFLDFLLGSCHCYLPPPKSSEGFPFPGRRNKGNNVYFFNVHLNINSRQLRRHS